MGSVGPGSWPWLTLATLALGAAFATLPESLRVACEYDRLALIAGQVWRVWTAHFVHFSVRHASVDLLTLAAFGACIERRCGWRVLAFLLICAPLLLSSALYFAVPDLLAYRGASALCVACGAMLGLILWHEVPAMRRGLLVMTGAFACKLVYEAMCGAMNVSGLHGDVRIAWQAHALGAAFGACAFTAWRWRRSSRIQESRDAASMPRLLA